MLGLVSVAPVANDHRPNPPSPDAGIPSLDEVDDGTYLRIKRIASRVVRRGLSQTLTPTAVAHEVWIRLARSRSTAPVRDGEHFDALVSQTARFVATDAARRRLSQKRRAVLAPEVDPDRVAARDAPVERILMIRQAIEALAADDEGTAGILRDHYWEGWSVAEISTKREMSRRSVERALTFGRAWVHDWLSRAATRPAGVHDD